MHFIFFRCVCVGGGAWSVVEGNHKSRCVHVDVYESSYWNLLKM